MCALAGTETESLNQFGSAYKPDICAQNNTPYTPQPVAFSDERTSSISGNAVLLLVATHLPRIASHPLVTCSTVQYYYKSSDKRQFITGTCGIICLPLLPSSLFCISTLCPLARCFVTHCKAFLGHAEGTKTTVAYLSPEIFASGHVDHCTPEHSWEKKMQVFGRTTLVSNLKSFRFSCTCPHQLLASPAHSQTCKGPLQHERHIAT
jgi:hypothetical protein